MELIELVAATPWLFTALAGVFGLLVGSFLNVVIHRVPVMLERDWRQQCRELLAAQVDREVGSQDTDKAAATKRIEGGEHFNLLAPRSHCPHCGHTITALENIPVLSWLLLRGRCSECGTAISPRYALVEILAALTAMAVAWHFGPGWKALAAMALSWALIALTFIDLSHHLLPDNITLPFLWIGLLLSLTGLFVTPRDALVGAASGYLVLWLVYWAFKLATGKEGMGHGDFKLLALLGAWMGWQMLPIVILLSSLVGSLVGIGLILFKDHGRDVPIPFGPYLAAAGWGTLMWGQDLLEAYLKT